MKRRDFLKLAGAVSLAGCATPGQSKARVVVIGGGFGGATAAKYIRQWDPAIDVVLVERDPMFVSCPISNLVLAGFSGMQEITRGYDGLRRHGVQVIRDEVTSIDAQKRTVRLASGSDIGYERLIVSPGIDFMYSDVQGYEAAMKAGTVLHAWKAGPQTVALRRQLDATVRAPSLSGPFAVAARGNRCRTSPYPRSAALSAPSIHPASKLVMSAS